jgi:hypothetical protein
MSEFTNNVIDASFDWTKRFAACEKIVSPFSSACEQASKITCWQATFSLAYMHCEASKRF